MAASSQLRDAPRVVNAIRTGTAETARVPHAPARIAVLPFADLSEDHALDCMAGTLMVLLIANLACRPDVRVASRTSSMHYKGTQSPLADIARELDVACVVEGSVLGSGSQLQIVVAVVDAATDATLVTRTYTGQAATIRRMQAAIAWALADEITAAVLGR